MRPTSRIWVEDSEAWGSQKQGWESRRRSSRKGLRKRVFDQALPVGHSCPYCPKATSWGGMKKKSKFSILTFWKETEGEKKMEKVVMRYEPTFVPQIPGSFSLVPVSCCCLPSAKERWNRLPCRHRYNHQWRGCYPRTYYPKICHFDIKMIWVEGNWEAADTGRTPPFCLKAGHKFPMVKVT